MPWGHFFTIVAQVSICIVLFFVGATMFSALLDAFDKKED